MKNGDRNINPPVLQVVHCIDTEGPLDEDISSTFRRINDLFGIKLEPSRETLEKLQRREVPLNGIEDEVATVISPQLLAYNRTWADIRAMLDEALSSPFRREMLDDFGRGWVYSWHCVDHLGFSDNPRRKDFGYGNIFRFYRDILAETNSAMDEVNWHFHPLSLTRNPLNAATSYANSMDVLLYVIARRIIDHQWFPTTSRPGFHAERPDAQQDTQLGRFGDWRRAPESWAGYHPHHDDYQRPGNCRRWIYRCLNLGTRLRLLTEAHVQDAFTEARQHGSAIVAFADHDYRDIRPDVRKMREMLTRVRRDFPDVQIRFSGAEEAARAHVRLVEPALNESPPEFLLEIFDNRVHVRLKKGSLFGPQPFLALKTRDGRYFNDNFDIVTPGCHWTYVLDDQTLPMSALEVIGVGGAGRSGGSGVALHFVQTKGNYVI
jgi:hypothetical protein